MCQFFLQFKIITNRKKKIFVGSQMLYFLQQSVEEKAFLSFVTFNEDEWPRNKKKTTLVQLCDTCVRLCNTVQRYAKFSRMRNECLKSLAR